MIAAGTTQTGGGAARAVRNSRRPSPSATPVQPAHPLDFAYLVGDALFELLVELVHLLRLRFHLIGSLAQFLEQSCILDVR